MFVVGEIPYELIRCVVSPMRPEGAWNRKRQVRIELTVDVTLVLKMKHT